MCTLKWIQFGWVVEGVQSVPYKMKKAESQMQTRKLIKSNCTLGIETAFTFFSTEIDILLNMHCEFFFFLLLA